MTTPGDDEPTTDGPVRAGAQAAMPSMQLLRSLTDERVVTAVIEHGRLTRAEISTATGISKPTISESVRRLTAADVLVDTGERTNGRGRAGSYYTLSGAAGTALIVSIRHGGVTAETVDAFGATVDETTIALGQVTGEGEVADVVNKAVRNVRTGRQMFRLATVSAADPVERSSGRLVQLPDAPLLVGSLDPVALLAPMVSGPVWVDNDVNWAARAEHDTVASLDDFVYLHLGEGLGCAVVVDGNVVRGHGGLAGEVAHLVTVGPGGRAMALTEVFAHLQLRRSGTTAIDVDRVIAELDRHHPEGRSTLETIALALSGVVAAAVALADPEQIVLGGSWGLDPRVADALTTALEASPRTVMVRASAQTGRPDHQGARTHGISELRATIAAGR